MSTPADAHEHGTDVCEFCGHVPLNGECCRAGALARASRMTPEDAENLWEQGLIPNGHADGDVSHPRYCLNIHGEAICDGPQGHDDGCTFTPAWMLVRRLEDHLFALARYAGETINELRALREASDAVAEAARHQRGFVGMSLSQETIDALARLDEVRRDA